MDEEAAAIRERIRQNVTANPRVLQMHAFNLDKEEKMIRFDIVVSFDAEDRRAIYQEVCENVQREYPDYTLQVAMDTDFSEVSD